MSECVFVRLRSQLSMGPERFEYSCPATHCLPRQWDISLYFNIPSSLSISTIAKNLSRQENPPLLLYFCQLILYLRSASMRHYLPSSILFIEESPPISPPAELPHHHQSASRGRLVSAATSLSLFTV